MPEQFPIQTVHLSASHYHASVMPDGSIVVVQTYWFRGAPGHCPAIPPLGSPHPWFPQAVVVSALPAPGNYDGSTPITVTYVSKPQNTVAT